MGKLLTPIDVISSIVSKTTAVIPVDSISAVVDGVFTIATTDTAWISLNQTIEIGGDKYRVKNFVCDTSVEFMQVGHVDVIAGNSFVLPAPTFHNGTYIMVQEEQREISIAGASPFVWLAEVIKENFPINNGRPKIVNAPVRMFILTEADKANWSTADHYSNVIEPMRTLGFALLKRAILETGVYPLSGDATITSHANAGAVEKNGHPKALFNENLSGVELTFSLPYNPNKCK